VVVFTPEFSRDVAPCAVAALLERAAASVVRVLRGASLSERGTEPLVMVLGALLLVVELWALDTGATPCEPVVPAFLSRAFELKPVRGPYSLDALE